MFTFNCLLLYCYKYIIVINLKIDRIRFKTLLKYLFYQSISLQNSLFGKILSYNKIIVIK